MGKLADLELNNITKAYGGTAVVKGISLSVVPGEFISLLGPSGCGKTTTLSMIAGFEMPTSGEILVRGRRIDSLAPEKRDSGMVFQSYALFPHMTVAENIAFGLKMRRRPKADILSRVRRTAELVRIEHLLERQPRELSGGQQQRVALARALIIEPALLLLDEPFGALDKQLREDLQIEVKTLLKRLGVTTIFVTHDQDEAMSMSDRIAVMNAGVIEQIASPKTLYQQPATRFVADFIGKANFLLGRPVSWHDGQVSIQTTAGIIMSRLSRPLPDGEVECFVRPESVRLLDPGDTADNRIEAIVVETAYFGDRERVVLELPGGTRFLMLLDRRSAATNSPFVAERVAIGWRTQDSALFVAGKRVD
jgi:putative spermidine/putrescine transport system ATP-binding protein